MMTRSAVEIVMCQSIFNLITVLCLLGSGSYSVSSFAQSSVPPDTVITLQTTRCFGSCPPYELEIRADGQVFFRFREFYRDPPYFRAVSRHANISQKQVRELVAAFETANY